LRPPLPQPAALAGPLLHFKVPLPLLLMAGTEQKAVKNARIYPQICSHGGPPGFFFRGFCNHNIEATIFWNSGQILPSPGTL
jgi:hypothetical protein